MITGAYIAMCHWQFPDKSSKDQFQLFHVIYDVTGDVSGVNLTAEFIPWADTNCDKENNFNE